MRQNLIRWLTAACFLLIYPAAFSQTLNKLEYFFDKDPGVGKGTIVSLSPSVTIDQTFTFNVSGLSNGLHFLFVRVQDNKNNWSLSAITPFTKTEGNSTLAMSKLEYYFDTDPGVGKGQPFPLSASSLVDSTVHLNVSGLTDGLHLLYLRAQDAFGQWSTTYSSSFVKTPGSDSAVISKLEYFVDADPGVGKGTALSVKEANDLNDTVTLNIPDNGTDKRYYAIRAMDKKGQWSLLYVDSVSLCDLYKAKPAFTWVKYADLYSFVDSTQNNPSHKLLWNFDNLGRDSVSNPQFTFPQGNHSVTLTAGIGCRRDSATLPLYTGLEKYEPDSTYTGGDVVMTFYGGGLDTMVNVSLLKGGAEIKPYGKAAFESRTLQGIFDLHNAATGTYDVRLQYPNGFDTTITAGLKVGKAPVVLPDSSIEPKINIVIAGPNVVRYGSTFYPTIVVTNESPVLAKYVNVWVVGDSLANWSFNPPLHFEEPSADLAPYVNDIPPAVMIDTLDGKPLHSRLYNFIIPYILPGATITIPLKQIAPQAHGVKTVIYYWTSKPMFGSPLTWYWLKCLSSVVGFALNTAGLFFPPAAIASCAYSVVQFFVFSFTQYADDFYHGTINYKKLVYEIASTLLGCIPGAKAVGTAGKVIKAAQIIEQKLIQWWNGLNYVNANGQNFYNGTNDCFSLNNETEVKPNEYPVTTDPNDKSGPTGFTADRFVNNSNKFNYEVDFENLPTATGDVQRIYVTDTLDKSKFDLSSFSLLGFGLADSFKVIPPYRPEYTQTYDLRPSRNLLLRLNAKLDTATGVLNYTFLSLDPITKDTLPISDVRGFLPPDSNGVNGRGFVLFNVNMKKGLPHGTKFQNKATIVFDNNAPMTTNTWINTLDTIPPTGGITSGDRLNDTTVLLHFGGADVGAGVGEYHLYGAEGNNPYILLGRFKSDTVRFAGQRDSVYRFYVVPLDSVYNLPNKPAAAEYTVSLSKPLPVTILSFNAQKQQSNVIVTWKVASEEQFSHYEVERSFDGIHFEKIGTVVAQAGNGVKFYAFADVNVLATYYQRKDLYYRLRMVDKDNTARYSRVARISLNQQYTVSIFPNPAKDDIFIDGLEHYHTMQIADANGKVVLKKPVTPGMYSINIANFKAGTYIVTLVGNDDTQSLKFVKL